MSWLPLVLILASALPAAAHEGHDHGTLPPAPRATDGIARASAATPDVEMVAVMNGKTLKIYLDRYATNEPLARAVVDVESGGFKATATAHAPGAYTMPAEALARPGKHALTIGVQAGDLSELLSATLQVDEPQAAPSSAGGWGSWWRRPAAARQSAAAIASDAVPPQRLPDGSVFLPKPAQYQLAVRHQVAQVGEHPMTIEFSGRVVADPSASGRVQATQSGRIEVGAGGLPVIGQRVAKGQWLATVRPSMAAIERGNQQALRAELEAQRAIAESRLQRLEQLDGAVPRKDVEAARIELQALRQRSEAVGAGLTASEPLVAPVAGVVSAVHVVAGQVVDARETLIEIVDPSRLAVEALAHDPVLPRDLADASADAGGQTLALLFVGAGRQLREQAMPLLFRIRGSDAVLAVGQPVKVIARTTRKTSGVAMPRAALVRLPSGEPGVWVHESAERFVPRRVAAQPLDGATVLLRSGVAGGERVVTEGASLLAQVR